MKKIIFVYALLIIAVVILATMKGNISIPKSFLTGNPTANINNKTFTLLVARSNKEKELGLSKRDKLDLNSGMLFTFDKKGIYNFWMRDMRFPIDIIYIDDSTIVDIIENAPVPKELGNLSTLPVYKPRAEANYVLEINSGLSKKYKINIGDKVKFSNL